MEHVIGDEDPYAILSDLNKGFRAVLEALRQFEEIGVVEDRPKLIQGLRLTIEEARAWANFELTGALGDRIEAEWARFGKLRREWDARSDVP